MPKRDPEVKNLRFSLRLSDRERELWQAAADAEDRALGDFIRHSVTRAARGVKALHVPGGADRYLTAKRAGR